MWGGVWVLWGAGRLVVAVGVQGELAEQFAGGGVTETRPIA